MGIAAHARRQNFGRLCQLRVGGGQFGDGSDEHRSLACQGILPAGAHAGTQIADGGQLLVVIAVGGHGGQPTGNDATTANPSAPKSCSPACVAATMSLTVTAAASAAVSCCIRRLRAAPS